MIDTDVLRSLLHATHRLTQLAARTTGSVIPSATWRALSTLEADGPQRVGELASVNRVSQPGMSRLVAGMLEDGLVRRHGDPDDSRASVIALTDRGRDALDEWRRVVVAQLGPRFNSLDDEDWATLRRASAILASRTSPNEASEVAA
ncbi:MAG: MarR family transcriptional regulator [Actinomycetales bacterium]|nr:MarR family transcriptional regulator [Actinomycetales bacterium]